jgi:hypothetical protein
MRDGRVLRTKVLQRKVMWEVVLRAKVLRYCQGMSGDNADRASLWRGRPHDGHGPRLLTASQPAQSDNDHAQWSIRNYVHGIRSGIRHQRPRTKDAGPNRLLSAE